MRLLAWLSSLGGKTSHNILQLVICIVQIYSTKRLVSFSNMAFVFPQKNFFVVNG